MPTENSKTIAAYGPCVLSNRLPHCKRQLFQAALENPLQAHETRNIRIKEKASDSLTCCFRIFLSGLLDRIFNRPDGFMKQAIKRQQKRRLWGDIRGQ